ncbi:MAG: Na+/H+ antiporter NhaA [Psychromonas sp.]|nr:Na+/H+ antiporter NhaA [Psychromonas sp.]
MSSQKWHWLHSPITGGVLLMISSTIALAWANMSPQSYHAFWYNSLWTVSLGGINRIHSINFHQITNEFLMAIFFFFIGLEIKRELLDGELSSFKKASLPLFAAIGGVIVPAGIYYFFNSGTSTVNGWGIPMATDIAFALGVLAIVGTRVPLSLKIFLSALAIGDDLMAVIVIAIFYTHEIYLNSLLYGMAGIAILIIANKIGIRNKWFYYAIGLIIVWVSFLMSGIHATIAGIAVAFTVPSRRAISMDEYLNKTKNLLKGLEPERFCEKDILSHHAIKSLNEVRILSFKAANPLQLKEGSLHPLTSLFIVPFFALGNAGVIINKELLHHLTNPIVLGIALGLIFGKPLGIYFFTKLLIILKIGELPQGVTWSHVIGVGFLAGMGFTMSIFITDLALTEPKEQVIAKVSVLIASVLSGIIGYLILINSKQAKT